MSLSPWKSEIPGEPVDNRLREITPLGLSSEKSSNTDYSNGEGQSWTLVPDSGFDQHRVYKQMKCVRTALN